MQREPPRWCSGTTLSNAEACACVRNLIRLATKGVINSLQTGRPVGACLQDAARLAQKVVTNYGMSDLGITVHAPPAGGSGFMRKSFEARVYSPPPF